MVSRRFTQKLSILRHIYVTAVLLSTVAVIAAAALFIRPAFVHLNSIAPAKAQGATGTIFVSSRTYTGNLGGVTGANATCQTLADASSRVQPGVWRAWISSDTTNVITNFEGYTATPLQRVDGQLVANNLSGLWSKSLPLTPIAVTELGGIISVEGEIAWTGTLTDGQAAAVSKCGNWTAAIGTGHGGVVAASDPTWTDGGANYSCATPARVYCVYYGPSAPPPDVIPPVVQSFALQPRALVDPAVLNWTVTDNQALSSVQLWRAPDNNRQPGVWAPVGSSVAVTGVSASGQFTDTPAAGTWWYGMRVTDTSGNFGVEPNPPGPVEVVKNVSSDLTPPVVQSFTLRARTTFNPIVFDWTVTDETALVAVQLWRAPNAGGLPGAWGPVTSNLVSGTSASGQFTDIPASGAWWYGIHVLDQAGNVGNEPVPPGPLYAIMGPPPDTIPPVVQSFAIAPRASTDPVILNWIVTDNTALADAQLWRAADASGAPGAWGPVTSQAVSGTSASGQFTDTPTIGTWWYGIHVLDATGNMGIEPVPPGPLRAVRTALTCDDPPPVGHGAFLCSPGGPKTCAGGINEDQPCITSFDCPGSPSAERGNDGGNLLFTPVYAQTSPGQYFACVANPPAEVCPGEELVDDDPASVCCSVACTAAPSGVLTIQNVTAVSVSNTGISAQVDLSWRTLPQQFESSQCTTTYQPVSGTGSSCTDPATCLQTTGAPNNHSTTMNLTGLAGQTQYTFTIRCTQAGFGTATHTGTFTAGRRVAIPGFAITDLNVSDVTAATARISYGTNRAALGTVSWKEQALGNTACGAGGFINSITDTVFSLAHSAFLQALTPEVTVCVEVRASDQSGGAAPARYITFNTPRQAPVVADANVIMQVTKNRTCSNWLYCQSSVRLRNERTNKSEDVCFDLGVCDALDPQGTCANPVFSINTDATELTYNTPAQVHRIKDISGYAKVGLDWGPNAQGNPQRVDGYYPYVSMSEQGRAIDIPNGNFETGDAGDWGPNYPDCSKPSDCIKVLRGTTNENSSYFLKVNPGQQTYTGARVSLGPIFTTGESMILTFRARADNVGKVVRAQLAVPDPAYTPSGVQPTYHSFVDPTAAQNPADITLSTSWETYQLALGPEDGDPALENFSGDAAFQIVQKDPNTVSHGAFYIDDVVIAPVLRVGVARTIPPSCRLYPKPDAPACDFKEVASQKEYQGWRGYCIERHDPDPARALDPENECLIWWPVDAVAGRVDLFNTAGGAGYAGRKPLYYCLEGSYDYPFYKHVVSSGMNLNIAHNVFPLYVNVEDLDIHKDEIFEIRINDVEVKSGSFGGQTCKVQGATHPPSGPPHEQNNLPGWIVFNHQNIDDWTKSFVINHQSIDPLCTSVINPFAQVFCENLGGEYQCDALTARLDIDSDTQKLKNIVVKYSGTVLGTASYSDITVTYRPRCDVIAQVVTPTGKSVPYSSRLDHGWNQDNEPQYGYDQDYAPYGGLVIGDFSNLGNPETWPKPAYLEAPQKNGVLQAPYQYRAGSPYGLRLPDGACWYKNVLTSTWTKASEQCSMSSDCTNPPSPSYSSPGECRGIPTEGGMVCVTGSSERLGKPCSTSPHDCGYVDDGTATPPLGICAGINLPEAWGGDWFRYYLSLNGGAARGGENLNQLFARVYGVWALNKSTSPWKYVQCKDTNDPVPGCISRDSLDVRANADPSLPVVSRIEVEGPPVIERAGGVVLKFTVIMDGNRLPMTGYRVNWGDGSRETAPSGLSILPKSSMSDPHIALHTYQCGPNGSQGPNRDPIPACSATSTGYNCYEYDNALQTVVCKFKPMVQAQDNWSWCNGNSTSGNPIGKFDSACAATPSQDPTIWQPYRGLILVKP